MGAWAQLGAAFAASSLGSLFGVFFGFWVERCSTQRALTMATRRFLADLCRAIAEEKPKLEGILQFDGGRPDPDVLGLLPDLTGFEAFRLQKDELITDPGFRHGMDRFCGQLAVVLRHVDSVHVKYANKEWLRTQAQIDQFHNCAKTALDLSAELLSAAELLEAKLQKSFWQCAASTLFAGPHRLRE